MAKYIVNDKGKEYYKELSVVEAVVLSAIEEGRFDSIVEAYGEEMAREYNRVLTGLIDKNWVIIAE